MPVAVVRIGPIADRPTCGTASGHQLWFVTDIGNERWTYCNGSDPGWIDVGPGLDVGVIPLAYLPVGSTTGKIPLIPVPMSQMSAPVKSTIDAITANADSAAYHPVSAFATTAQGTRADTALQSVLAATLSASGLMSAADFANLQFLVSLLQYSRRPQVVKHGVNIGTANSDALIITDMPAKYLITRLSVFNASSALSTVSAGLYTGAGGVGAIVGPSVVVAANANVFFDFPTPALTVRTNTPLYFRIAVPKAATTISVLIEFLNLT